MQDSPLRIESAWNWLSAAWPDFFRMQARTAGCASEAAAVVTRTAMAIWTRQAHILACELDLASRGFGTIAARNPAVRATCVEISRDDLDMVAGDVREIGQLVISCGADLVVVYAGCLQEAATLTTSPTP